MNNFIYLETKLLSSNKTPNNEQESNLMHAITLRNSKDGKTEFYWKLHEVTLKIKDYVKEFKPSKKKNNFDFMINKAFKSQKSLKNSDFK